MKTASATVRPIPTGLLAPTRLLLGLVSGFAVGVVALPSLTQPVLANESLPETSSAHGSSLALTEGVGEQVEEQIQDMGEVLEAEIRDRIDPEAIERTARPIVRRSLRTFLDVAPELSRQAIILGEWYLGQWGDRALEELENAAETLEDLEDKI